MNSIEKLKYLIVGTFSISMQWIIDHNYIEPFVALVIVLSMDTLLGVIKAIRERKFSSAGFFCLFTKIIKYFGSVLALILLHSFLELSILKSSVNLIIGAIIFNELVSSAENVFAINPKSREVIINILQWIRKLKK